MAIPKITDTSALNDLINSNLSDDQKSKGASKIGQIISDQGVKIATIILPIASTLAEQLGIDPNNLQVPDLCPTENTLNNVLPTLNNLIDDLNQTGILVTDLTKVVSSIAVGGQILQSTADALNTTLPSLQAAIVAIPPPGLPGAVVGAVDILDYINRNILLKKDGTPSLPPITSAISSSALALVVTSSFILQVTGTLQTIVALLKQCFPEVSINSVEPSVLALAESAKPKDQENSLQGYKGFNLEIVEVPFNDILTQRKAVAKNQSGEIVLQTELSFTTKNNTLIIELKNIIDQSGLIGNVTQNSLTSTVPPSILSNNIDPKTVQSDLLQDRIKNTTDQFINQYKILETKIFSISPGASYPKPNFKLPINLQNYDYNLAQFDFFKKSVLDLNFVRDADGNTQETDTFKSTDFYLVDSIFQKLTNLISLTKQ